MDQPKKYYLVADKNTVLKSGYLDVCEIFLKENRSTYSQYSSIAIYNQAEFEKLGIKDTSQ